MTCYEWFTGRPWVAGQFPVDPVVPEPNLLTGAETIVIVLLVMKLIEIVIKILEVLFKLTPSTADDTWLAQVKGWFEWLKSVLSKLGIGCLLVASVAIYGCSQPRPAPAPTPAKAVAKISGPSDSQPGLPVVLDASDSTGDLFDWQTDQPAVYADQGRQLIVVPGSGRHVIKLTVVAGGLTLTRARAEHVLTVGSPTPPGPTPPGPVPPVPVPPGPVPPGPTPPQPGPLPPGKYQLAQWAHDAAIRTVSSPGRATQAKRLADACRSLVSAIKAGAFDNATVVDIASAAMKSMDDALGLDVSAWQDWRDELGIQLRSKVGLIRDRQEFAVILDELATGLESVR